MVKIEIRDVRARLTEMIENLMLGRVDGYQIYRFNRPVAFLISANKLERRSTAPEPLPENEDQTA